MKRSPTQDLVSEIEVLTGMIFGPEQRKEIADRIRVYRFKQVNAAMMRIKELFLKSGNSELSAQIFSDIPEGE